MIESAAFGLGYVCVLIWTGSALVGSFSGYEATPYWPVIPHLRTDTLGFLAFAVSAVSLSLSRFLQLSRHRGGGWVRPEPRSTGMLGVQAVADTALLLGTAMVLYLSLNAFTHPETLRLQLTHLLPGPSEGTVRVIALGICLVAATVRRYLRAAEGDQEALLPADRPDRSAGRPAGRSQRAGTDSRGQQLVERLRNTAASQDVAGMSTEEIIALLRGE